jgi:predicted secreted protein
MKILSAIMLLGLLGPAYAESVSRDFMGSRISLDARATEQVANDVMRAILFIELEDADAGKLAQKVNHATNDALKLARTFVGLRAKTSGYSTYPITDKNKIVRWRSRSEMSIEGEDFPGMTDAISQLQGSMQLGAVSFSVSPRARAIAEETLMQAAISSFLRKADAATKGFGGSNFTVAEATVATEGANIPSPRPMAVMKSGAQDNGPAFEAGSSHLTVIVNGSILIAR